MSTETQKDASGNITGTDDWTYTYDENGNILGSSETQKNASGNITTDDWAYTYNTNGDRLSSSETQNDYTYDANGHFLSDSETRTNDEYETNRNLLSSSGYQDNSTYDAHNHLLSSSEIQTNDGNITDADNWTYTYNANGSSYRVPRLKLMRAGKLRVLIIPFIRMMQMATGYRVQRLKLIILMMPMATC